MRNTYNNTSTNKYLRNAFLALLLTSNFALADTLSIWNGSGANDQLLWSTLGSDGTVVAQTFSSLLTNNNLNTVSGSFENGTGMVALQCDPSSISSCSWSGNFNPGDTSLWANNGVNGTGALNLNFNKAVFAAGLTIQNDFSAAFTAQISINGQSFSVSSDNFGNPVFIGVQDSIANISSLNISLVSCTGCDVNDFAVDSVVLQEQLLVPEPNSPMLMAIGLALLYWQRHKLKAAI